MKVHANKLQLILGLVLATQVACSKNPNQTGQVLYPNVATQQSSHSSVGDAFGAAQPLNNGGNLGNLFNNAARVLAQNPGNGIAIDPITGMPVGATIETKVEGTVTKKDGTTSGDGAGAAEETQKFTVELDKESAWRAACVDALGRKLSELNKTEKLDTDGDGIYDICEDTLVATKHANWIGLDKTVYNGAIIVAKKFFDEKNKLFGDDVVPKEKGFIAPDAALQSIRLTEGENSAWKQAKDLGKMGAGADSRFDRQITKKFFARSVLGGNDMAALRDMMSLEQIQIKDKRDSKGVPYNPYFQASDSNKIAKTGIDNGLTNLSAYTNSKTSGGGQLKDMPQFALVKNNPVELIPFTVSSDGTAVANLSGIHRDAAQTLRTSQEFMYVAETHLVIPEEMVGDGMELRVGNLISDRTQALAGSKAGMFFVIHNNETDIVTTDLIKNNLTGDELKASMNTIGVPSNCTTVHLAIAFLADSKKVAEGMQTKIFNENVFYHQTKALDGTEKNVWKPLPQEWLRLKALSKNDKQKCDVSADEIVLQEVRDYMKLEVEPAF